MIVFEKLRYKNILSSGNTFTELDLFSNPTTLIVGTNGSGKSTFLDAITFVLFGKPFRKIKKDQLINSINKKNLLVEIEFNTNGNQYLVRRGMKPTIFEIYQNGILLNQDSSAKDYQSILESQILNMNYKSFCQIIILGASTFVPFMQLTAGQRREIIEDILDLQIFSSMNILLKEKIQQNKIDITNTKNYLEVLKEKILVHRELIKKLKKNDEDLIKEIKNKIDLYQSKIDDYKKLLEDKKTEVVSLKNTILDHPEIQIKKTEVYGLIMSLNEKNNLASKEISFYKNHDNCPTCKQDITEDHKTDILATKEVSINEMVLAIELLEEKRNIIEVRLNEISNVLLEITTLERKVSEYTGNISTAEAHINSLKKDLVQHSSPKGDISDETTVMENMKNEWLEMDKILEQFLNDKNVLDAAAVLLKDTGIKSRIIKQYVPIINKFINKYLSIVELPIGFELDEVFNETIKSRFRDEFSYASFSEGEKMRIDLALMFTWRAVAKIRNSVSTNLLIMDEVFDSSLDLDGVDQVAQIVGSISGDSNVFIISHKESMIDKFTNIIRYEKHKDFSRIVT